MLNRYAWSLLCLVSSTQVHAFDCEQAQKAILNLDASSASQVTVSDTAFIDQKLFVASKPKVKGSSVAITSFVTTAQGYEQLWCKLKSQEAVLAETKLSAAGVSPDCADFNKDQLEQALASLPEAAAAYSLDTLGIRVVADQDFGTGSQWAPSSVQLVKKDGDVTVQATRLKSATWIPIVGGMNYCKLLSPAGARQLLTEQIVSKGGNVSEREAATWQKIEWKGASGAYVLTQGHLEEAVAAAAATFIISPGAEIPPTAMSGLAQQLAQRGYLAIVMQYPNNNSILEGLSGKSSAATLATFIKTAPQEIKGFNAKPLTGKPVYVVGHSLGGATLASEIFRKGQPSVFDHIFLYGTSSFVKIGGSNVPTSSPMTFLFGEHDGLSGKNIPKFLSDFSISFDPQSFDLQTSSRYPSISYQQIQGLNHFCIVTDTSVGNSGLKKKDGPGLEPDACVAALAQALVP